MPIRVSTKQAKGKAWKALVKTATSSKVVIPRPSSQGAQKGKR